jgi:hypothetical protein
MERLNLKKLNDVRVKRSIALRSAIGLQLLKEVGISRAWEGIGGDITISTRRV